MNKILISLMIAMLFVLGSCGDEINCTDVFPNKHDGLCWSDALYDKTWNEAVEYCEGLDGRLPTISELRTLIQNCSPTENGGKCDVADNCLDYDYCWNDVCYGCVQDNSGKYSVFGDKNYVWSFSGIPSFSEGAWSMDFRRAGVCSEYKIMDRAVRCVR